MGNCITSGEIMITKEALTEDNHKTAGGRRAAASLGADTTGDCKTEKKTNYKDGCDDDSLRWRNDSTTDQSKKKKAVRVRVVMTQEELSQILNYYKNGKNNQVSVGELLNSMNNKLSKRKVRRNSQDGSGGWRPALESIPEDH